MGHEDRYGVSLKGFENETLSGWRTVQRFAPGVRKFCKNTFNRRVRRLPVEIEDGRE